MPYVRDSKLQRHAGAVIARQRQVCARVATALQGIRFETTVFHRLNNTVLDPWFELVIFPIKIQRSSRMLIILQLFQEFVFVSKANQ